MGASAPGLLSAALLAERGFRVTIFERNPDPLPPRTLIVTSALYDLLGNLAAGCVVNHVHGFELFAGGRRLNVPLDEPDLVIERQALLTALTKRAQAAGAEIVRQARVSSLLPEEDGVRLQMSDPRERADGDRFNVVIGADGTRSRIAKTVNGPAHSVPLLQAIVRLPDDYPRYSSRVWFRPADTRYFYWLIPESDERGALGLIYEDGSDGRRLLTAFAQKQGFEVLGYQAARVPEYRHWVPVEYRFGNGHVYLVGDAASQVKVSTVGGVVTGLRGALGVADTITFGRSHHLRTLRRELNTHRLLRRVLHRFRESDYERLLHAIDGPTLTHLSASSRDEALQCLWRVWLGQPRLLFPAIKSLLINRDGADSKRVPQLGASSKLRCEEVASLSPGMLRRVRSPGVS